MQVTIKNIRSGQTKAVEERYARILVKTGKFSIADEAKEDVTVRKAATPKAPAKEKKAKGKPGRPAKSTYQTKVIVAETE